MENKELVKKIKAFRVDLDVQFTTMQQMKPSREISIAITSAQNAKLWLGQVLKGLDQPNPYPDSKDARNDNIEPTADTAKHNDCSTFLQMSHIKQVKVMRQRLTAIYEKMHELRCLYGGGIANTDLYAPFNKSWEYVVESNMWMGNELGRINRENQSK